MLLRDPCLAQRAWVGKFYKKQKIYHHLNQIFNKAFVVSVDQGVHRFFLNFPSIYNFENWYVKLLPDERTINEVVTTDIRKLVIDIDGDPNNDDLLHLFDFERHIRSRIHDVFMTLDIGTPDVILYSMKNSSGNWCTNKLSYHAVVSNYAFSARTCLGLSMIISSGQAWVNNVDAGVYKSVQCIRMAGSTKFGEQRWKWTIQGANTQFRRGVVSCLEGTVLSDVTCNLVTIGDVHTGVELRSGIDFTQFKIDRTTRFGTRLDRIKPGYCHQCNRKHDNENAVIKHLPDGRHVFMCWRFVYR